MIDRVLLDKLYDSIRKVNFNGDDSIIPLSDQFIRDFVSAEGYSESEVKQALIVLSEVHRLFIITIVRDNPAKNIQKLEGYVVAEIDVVSNLKRLYQKRLTDVYNKENHSNKIYQQIYHDIIGNLGSVSNTNIGRLANIAIMLNEYENLMNRYPDEFTYNWREAKLKELFSSGTIVEEKESEPLDNKVEFSTRSRRAVDQPQFESFSNDTKKLPPEKLIQIYGVDFFFRVKLRRYEFDELLELIRDGHIKRRADLLLLRDMVKKIKNNFDRDTELSGHFEDIFRLDREISKRLFFLNR